MKIKPNDIVYMSRKKEAARGVWARCLVLSVDEAKRSLRLRIGETDGTFPIDGNLFVLESPDPPSGRTLGRDCMVPVYNELSAAGTLLSFSPVEAVVQTFGGTLRVPPHDVRICATNDAFTWAMSPPCGGGCDDCTECEGPCEECTCSAVDNITTGGECRHCGAFDDYPDRGDDGKVCCWRCANKERGS